MLLSKRNTKQCSAEKKENWRGYHLVLFQIMDSEDDRCGKKGSQEPWCKVVYIDVRVAQEVPAVGVCATGPFVDPRPTVPAHRDALLDGVSQVVVFHVKDLSLGLYGVNVVKEEVQEAEIQIDGDEEQLVQPVPRSHL